MTRQAQKRGYFAPDGAMNDASGARRGHSIGRQGRETELWKSADLRRPELRHFGIGTARILSALAYNADFTYLCRIVKYSNTEQQ